MMKRGLHKKLGPGTWAGVGGHMEVNDMKDPRALAIVDTCYREVYEETGIERAAIQNLKLRYIAIRKADGEIRMHHHFIGEIETEVALPHCDEGDLHWVDKADIPALPMSPSVGLTLKHWLSNIESEDIFLVAVNDTNESATISAL